MFGDNIGVQIWVCRSVAAAPAKEIEGVGQPLLSRK